MFQTTPRKTKVLSPHRQQFKLNGRETFQVNEADPHRETFEAFGVRVAMHLERRAFGQVDEVVAEAKRFIYEIDNPSLASNPLKMPIAIVIGDLRLINALEESHNISTVEKLLSTSPSEVAFIPNVGAKSIRKIQESLRKLLSGFDMSLAAVAPEWDKFDCGSEKQFTKIKAAINQATRTVAKPVNPIATNVSHVQHAQQPIASKLKTRFDHASINRMAVILADNGPLHMFNIQKIVGWTYKRH